MEAVRFLILWMGGWASLWAIAMWAIYGFRGADRLWRPRDDRAAVARLALELVDRGEMKRHGIEISWAGNVQMANGTIVNVGGWYRRKIKRAVADKAKRDEQLRMLAGMQQLAENIIKFERRWA